MRKETNNKKEKERETKRKYKDCRKNNHEIKKDQRKMLHAGGEKERINKKQGRGKGRMDGRNELTGRGMGIVLGERR